MRVYECFFCCYCLLVCFCLSIERKSIKKGRGHEVGWGGEGLGEGENEIRICCMKKSFFN